jgi:hypothetical protein
MGRTHFCVRRPASARTTTISDTEGDFEALPTRQFGTLEDEAVLVGLGYRAPSAPATTSTSASAYGSTYAPIPYAQARYQIVRAFGSTGCSPRAKRCSGRTPKASAPRTRTYLDRAPLRHAAAALGQSREIHGETIGLEWYTQLTLFQSLDERHRPRLPAADRRRDGQRGAADASLRPHDLAPAAELDWLFLELRAAFPGPVRKVIEERKPSPEIGVALEMQFGNRPR